MFTSRGNSSVILATPIVSPPTIVIYDAPSLSVTTYYRRKVTSTLNGKDCVDYSNCITVYVNDVTAGTVGSDQTICGNNPDAFTVITPATGSGVLSYQWQSSTTDCTNGFF